MTRAILFLTVGVFFTIFTGSYLANEPMTGKEIFYTIKGPCGSCNSCHPNGGTAGRWDSEYNEISKDGDRIIPSLKGIGKKKTPEQLEKAIKVVGSKYKVPVNESQIKLLADYVSKL